MPTLTIHLTDDEHRRLRDSAAREGCSVETYVRAQSLDAASHFDPVEELRTLLVPRIAEARSGQTQMTTVNEIAREARTKRIGNV